MTEQNKTDKIISELKKENDALRFVVAKLEKESKEWNLRLQDPEPIQVLSVDEHDFEDESGILKMKSSELNKD